MSFPQCKQMRCGGCSPCSPLHEFLDEVLVSASRALKSTSASARAGCKETCSLLRWKNLSFRDCFRLPVLADGTLTKSQWDRAQLAHRSQIEHLWQHLPYGNSFPDHPSRTFLVTGKGSRPGIEPRQAGSLSSRRMLYSSGKRWDSNEWLYQNAWPPNRDLREMNIGPKKKLLSV